MSPKYKSTVYEKSRNLPGPGQYDSLRSSLNISMNAPAFKIGTSQRGFSIPKDLLYNPPPAHYDVKDQFIKSSSAAFGFGTSKR